MRHLVNPPRSRVSALDTVISKQHPNTLVVLLEQTGGAALEATVIPAVFVPMAADLKAQEAELRAQMFDKENSSDVESVKQKEAAIVQLGDVLVKLGDAQALRDLLSSLRTFFAVIPKAKTAKIVRGIVDQISKVPNSTELQVMAVGQLSELPRAQRKA